MGRGAHRFLVRDTELSHNFWLHDHRLLYQWRKVLRYQPGQQVVLFDGVLHDRLYRIEALNEREAHLIHVTDFKRRLPAKDVYLAWSLLKKDKNDWVLQKGTELGVSHFFPLLADRSEKTGFDIDRAERIITEAVEQCGRSDLPSVREPMRPETMLSELAGRVALHVCDEEGDDAPSDSDPVGILIGPEGGWSDTEKTVFQQAGIRHLNLHDFTLRAETAAIAAVSKVLQ